MNQEQYLKRFQEIINEMLSLTTNKNHDYAGKWADDAFRNFKLIESLGVTTTEAWFIVRMTDKIQRVSNLIKQDAKVADEKITDTLLDLATYSLMMKIYLEQKACTTDTPIVD